MLKGIGIMRSTKRVLALLVFVMAVVLLTSCASSQPTPQADTEAIPIVKGTAKIVAEGIVLPSQSVLLGFQAGGEVKEVLVKEGDRVTKGQALLRLSSARQQSNVDAAQAALAAAQADLAKLRAGARAEEIAAAQAAVDTAKASLIVAEAQVQSAQAGIAAAEGQIKQAESRLADLRAGATADDIRIAELTVERVRNELWGAQSYRDGIAGAVDRGQLQDYDKDKAEASVGIAYVAWEIAQAELERVKASPRAGQLAELGAARQIAVAGKSQAEEQVAVAEAQVTSARAQVAQAQAQLDLTVAGATEEDIKKAEAGVVQAQAALDAAQVALTEVTLVSPMEGTVTNLEAKAGQLASPSVALVTLADLNSWEIETTDLTEIEVVKVAVGNQVTVIPDALPSVELKGQVVAISNNYEEKRGDVTYTVRVRLDDSDPQLRWGMTVVVNFD